MVFAVVIGVADWVVAKTGVNIADQTGLTETFVGGVLTAVVTSLPESVTSVAAVRRGALTLAVGGIIGGIIGGNAFDTIFIAFSDIAYREGSIYHAITGQQVYLILPDHRAYRCLAPGPATPGGTRHRKHRLRELSGYSPVPELICPTDLRRIAFVAC